MITLLTPTRNRALAFSLLERWVCQQTTKEEIQWIVVNDGSEEYDYTMGQTVIRRTHRETCHSLCANILAGIPAIRGDKVLIVEDDDYYAPNYVEEMSLLLEASDLAGFAPATYYNLRTRKWRELKNAHHASLAQTGIRETSIGNLIEACRAGSAFVDLKLWKDFRGTSKISHTNNLHLGMKGMPGEKGIGNGHRYQGGKFDADFSKLHSSCGEDAFEYVHIFSIFLQAGPL